MYCGPSHIALAPTVLHQQSPYLVPIRCASMISASASHMTQVAIQESASRIIGVKI